MPCRLEIILMSRRSPKFRMSCSQISPRTKVVSFPNSHCKSIGAGTGEHVQVQFHWLTLWPTESPKHKVQSRYPTCVDVVFVKMRPQTTSVSVGLHSLDVASEEETYRSKELRAIL